jgi:hypothetical protein
MQLTCCETVDRVKREEWKPCAEYGCTFAYQRTSNGASPCGRGQVDVRIKAKIAVGVYNTSFKKRRTADTMASRPTLWTLFKFRWFIVLSVVLGLFIALCNF